MSTLSSSLGAVAVISAKDFLNVLRPKLADSSGVALGRWVTLGGGIFATAMALYIASIGSSSLWDQSMRLLALFGGPLPGVFALGMITRRAHSVGVIIGSVAGIAATVYVQNFTEINSFFHAFLAFAATVIVGYIASLLIRRPVAQTQLTGFTIWDLPPRAEKF